MKEEITSLQNPLVKRIRALKQKKHRRREKAFWVEGIHIVLEALDLGWGIEALVWAPSLLRSEPALQALDTANVRKVAVSAAVFHNLSDRQNPQGLGAIVRIPERRLADLAITPTTFLVVLEEPQDPGNVGTVIRTADAGGGTGVVLLGPAADPYDPRAVRASMGSLFAIPVVTEVSVAEFAGWAQAAGIRLIGSSAHAERDYRDVDYRCPLALLFGSEQKGMSPALRATADELVRIPMYGRATSLNLASAVAVLVFRARSSMERREKT